MNILVVHEKNWRLRNVFELQSFAEALSVRGHEIVAIEFNELWERETALDLWSTSQKFENVQRSIEGASVTLYRPGALKLPLLDRLSAGVTFLSCLKRVIEAHDIDVIFMYCVPTFGIQTISIARKFGIPVIFRAIDIPTELVPISFLKFPTKLIERYVYRNVDRISALTPALKRYVVGLGANAETVDLLRPGVRLSLFSPRPPNQDLMAKWGITSEDKVALYVGRMYEFAGLEVLVEQWGRILEAVPSAKLLFVGRGEEMENLLKLTSDKPWHEAIIFTDFQPFALMEQFINISEVGLIPFRLCEATIDIIPTKILEYLACGLPVISNSLPGTMELLAPESSGVVYADSTDDVPNKIIDLLLNDERRSDLGRIGADYVADNYSWTRAIDTLEGDLLAAIEK